MRFLIVLLLAGATGCNVVDAIFGRSDAPAYDSRIVWRIPGRTNIGVPWYDDSTAYFLGEAHTITAVNKRTGTVRWTLTLPVSTRPTTLGNGGFATEDRIIVADDEEVFALDKQDGSVLWRFSAEEGRDLGRDSPLAGEGVAFAGSATGYIFAIDILTGQRRWATQLSTSGGVVVWLGAVIGGTLFASFSDFDVAPERGAQGGVAALDAITGAVKWQHWLPHNVDSLSPTGTIDPVVIGSVVVAGARDGPVYAFDRLTGELRWTSPALPTPGSTTPATIRDIRWLCANSRLVYIGSDGANTVIAVEPESGNEKWRFGTRLGSPSWIRCDGSFVFVFYPLGGLGAYDAITGVHLWTLPNHEREKNHYFVGGAIDGNRLYAGGIYNINALRLD